MLRYKSYSWGWSLLHSSSPSTGSLRVGFMLLATMRQKAAALGHPHPSGAWTEPVISSNKLENVKKIQMRFQN